jgi:hypothetical protein
VADNVLVNPPCFLLRFTKRHTTLGAGYWELTSRDNWGEHFGYNDLCDLIRLIIGNAK